jgi:hypothetical protein
MVMMMMMVVMVRVYDSLRIVQESFSGGLVKSS